MNRPVDELIRIAEAGGGMTLHANQFRVEDLIAITGAAARHRARLVVTHSDILMTDQVVAVAAAGKGCVFFE
jgi:hypothetical protein